jgi:hypothetical protein
MMQASAQLIFSLTRDESDGRSRLTLPMPTYIPCCATTWTTYVRCLVLVEQVFESGFGSC